MEPPHPEASTASHRGFPGADLLRHLPRAPARVLVLAKPGELAAEALEEAGLQVHRGGPLDPSAAPRIAFVAAPEPEAGSPGVRAPRTADTGRPDAAADADASEPPPFAAIVARLPPAADATAEWLAAVLDLLRSHLEEEGRLVIVAEAAEPLLRRLTRLLFETRFALLRQRSADGALLLEARPARHRIRPYRPGDEAAILDLFEQAFHHRRSVERWRWAYEQNPYGHHRISLAEDEGGRLLAHYGGYPVVFWTDLDGEERRLPCVHIGDTMTAPEARRIGRGRTNLLSRTVAHFFATWSHGRTAFNYGSNTGKIQRFSRRTAQGRQVEAMPYRVRSLATPIPAPGPWQARLGGWRVERVEDFDHRWDELWRRCRGAYRFLAERDLRYLRWRYACPDVRYHRWAVFRRGRLVGWSVFRQEGERLVWGDALFDSGQPQAPAVLLSRALASPEHRASRWLEGWLTPRPAWWAEIVDRLGFEARPEPQDLGLIYASYEWEPGERMEEHLYYTKADFDLF